MPPPSLKARALKLLAQREHSRLELERKLSRHAADAHSLAQTLDGLQQRGLIDAGRVAESVLHRRAATHGAARIAHELRGRGLEADTIDAALAPLRESEHVRALAVWRRRFQAPAQDAAGRARQARFLLQRGFAPEVVRRVVQGLEDEP